MTKLRNYFYKHALKKDISFVLKIDYLNTFNISLCDKLRKYFQTN